MKNHERKLRHDSLNDLAGSWEMSDEEWNNAMKEIRRGRDKSSEGRFINNNILI